MRGRTVTGEDEPFMSREGRNTMESSRRRPQGVVGHGAPKRASRLQFIGVRPNELEWV